MPKIKQKKRNALVVCRDSNQFWTTQKQFWKWVREGVILKTADNPLKGCFIRADEEKMIVVGNTILNLACPNHLQEQRAQSRLGTHK